MKKSATLHLNPKSTPKNGGKIEAEPVCQPSKLFLMLLNSKATIIQRWWRNQRRQAPSYIPPVKSQTQDVNPALEVVYLGLSKDDEETLKRRKAKAKQARLVW